MLGGVPGRRLGGLVDGAGDVGGSVEARQHDGDAGEARSRARHEGADASNAGVRSRLVTVRYVTRTRMIARKM
jgi:hypothetical protein